MTLENNDSQNDQQSAEDKHLENLNQIQGDDNDADSDIGAGNTEYVAHETFEASTDAVVVNDDSDTNKDDQDKDGKQDDDKNKDAKKDGDDSTADADKDKTGDDDKSHPRNSAQKRINQAVRKQREAERRELAAKREAEDLRRQLESKNNGQNSNNDDSVNNGDSKPKQDDYESHEDWVEALTDWKIDQRNKSASNDDATVDKSGNDNNSDANANQGDVELDPSVTQNIADMFDASREMHEDFDEKVLNEELPMTPQMVEVLSETDNAGEIAYALANDHETAQRIAELGDNVVAIAREIGKVEAKLGGESAASNTANNSNDTQEKPTKKNHTSPRTLLKTMPLLMLVNRAWNPLIWTIMHVSEGNRKKQPGHIDI